MVLDPTRRGSELIRSGGGLSLVCRITLFGGDEYNIMVSESTRRGREEGRGPEVGLFV